MTTIGTKWWTPGGSLDGGTNPEVGAGFTGSTQKEGKVEVAGDPACAPP